MNGWTDKRSNEWTNSWRSIGNEQTNKLTKTNLKSLGSKTLVKLLIIYLLNPSCDCNCFFFFAVIRTRRYKRESIRNNAITKFKSCLRAEKKDMFTYVKEGNCSGLNSEAWDIRCKMISSSCYYLVTCKKMPQVLYWNCTDTHVQTGNPFCCDPICPGQIIT